MWGTGGTRARTTKKLGKSQLRGRYRYRECPVSIPKHQPENRSNGYRYRTSPVSIPRPLFCPSDFATCVDFGRVFIPRFYSELGFELCLNFSSSRSRSSPLEIGFSGGFRIEVLKLRSLILLIASGIFCFICINSCFAGVCPRLTFGSSFKSIFSMFNSEILLVVQVIMSE